MGEYDTPAIEAQDIPAAIGLLTRLPVRVDTEFAVERGAAAAWAYPIAGAVIALLSVAVAWGALWLGLGSMIAALLAVATGLITTGAMHEDGLADCADGFWGGYTSERRLEIMKDSQIGTYGVAALIMVLGLRWAAFVALIDADMFLGGVLAAALMSRALMVGVMQTLPNVRAGGLSAKAGQPGKTAIRVGAAIAFGGSLIAVGWAGLAMAFIGVGFAALVARIATAKIDGQTGDVLGATQQITEVACLLALIATL